MEVIVCLWEEHSRASHEDHTARQLLEHLLEGQHHSASRENKIMANLDNVTAILEQEAADIEQLATDVGTVVSSVAELQAEIAALQAGTISQETIDALAAKAQAVDDSINALDASIKPPTP
jgi:outer membrane murein-binding lipoprotein Lpp